MSYEVVIGIEVHAQLKTRSKLFCGCATAFGAPPNTQTCPVCLGHPGALPVLNRKAFALAVRAALALGCTVPPRTAFDRKNYYYPDLPKNFQITQQAHPVGVDGLLETEVGDEIRPVRIHNVHLEEDAGKLVHPEDGAATLVDLNRAGQPLLEIVTQPDMRTPEEADAYMHALRDVLLYTGVSDVKMEEGSLRFEASVSLRPAGQADLGTRVEVKNLNSMRHVRRVLEYEIARQGRVLDGGGEVAQETRLWNEEKAESALMRSKEDAHDYRYFPEPDLPPIDIAPAWLDEIRGTLPELPLARKKRLTTEHGISGYDAGVLVADPDLASYFERLVELGAPAKAAANWTTNEVLAALKEEKKSLHQFPIKAPALSALIELVERGTVNIAGAREAFAEMRTTGKGAAAIVEARGLAQISGEDEIRDLVKKAFAAQPRAVEHLRGGKEKARGALVGFVMRESNGKANPAVVNRWIDELL